MTDTLTVYLGDPPERLYGTQLLGEVDVPDFGRTALSPLVGDLRDSDKPSQLIHHVISIIKRNPPDARALTLVMPSGNYLFDEIPGTGACVIMPAELTDSLAYEPHRNVFCLQGQGRSTVVRNNRADSLTWLRIAPNREPYHQAGMWTLRDFFVQGFDTGVDTGPHGFDCQIEGMWFSAGRRHIAGAMTNVQLCRLTCELATEVSIELGGDDYDTGMGHRTISDCIFWQNNADIAGGESYKLVITGNQFESHPDFGVGENADPHLRIGPSNDVVIVGNFFSGRIPGLDRPRRSAAIDISHTSRIQISGNDFRDYAPPDGQAVLSFSDVRMLQCNNNIISARTTTAPAIAVSGESVGVQIRDNLIEGVAAGTGPERGISIAATVRQASVSGNQYVH